MSGCDHGLDDNVRLTFIGDSIIAGWDLQHSFSSMITYNMGVSGSRIDYIESLAGTMSGKNIVVIAGTNDSQLMMDETRDEYVERYLRAIDDLCATRVYLFEILPRHASYDRIDINVDIMKFNAAIRTALRDYPQITYIPAYSDFTGDYGGINPEYYIDGLHPNTLGYRILSANLMKAL